MLGLVPLAWVQVGKGRFPRQLERLGKFTRWGSLQARVGHCAAVALFAPEVERVARYPAPPQYYRDCCCCCSTAAAPPSDGGVGKSSGERRKRACVGCGSCVTCEHGRSASKAPGRRPPRLNRERPSPGDQRSHLWSWLGRGRPYQARRASGFDI